MLRTSLRIGFVVLASAALPAPAGTAAPQAAAASPRAFIDGSGPGWRTLGDADFVDVNGAPDTWIFKDDLIVSTGVPIGVRRTRQTFTNFELVVEWRHLKSGGNSGMFAWVPEEALTPLKPGMLPPGGIEIQMLDHGFREQYEKQSGKKGDWFTTNGDIFAVGKSRLTPFTPRSPDGSRSFPRKDLSHGVGEWNDYYVRAINGELRLWVNGEEVSGGSGAEPRTGYLCLEAEGAPIEFRHLRIRELP